MKNTLLSLVRVKNFEKMWKMLKFSLSYSENISGNMFLSLIFSNYEQRYKVFYFAPCIYLIYIHLFSYHRIFSIWDHGSTVFLFYFFQ